MFCPYISPLLSGEGSGLVLSGVEGVGFFGIGSVSSLPRHFVTTDGPGYTI